VKDNCQGTYHQTENPERALTDMHRVHAVHDEQYLNYRKGEIECSADFTDVFLLHEVALTLRINCIETMSRDFGPRVTVELGPTGAMNASLGIVADFEIAARFSPGPWWGFNGVDELELSGDVLTRMHYRVFRGRVP
jgi:hypothetical protein